MGILAATALVAGSITVSARKEEAPKRQNLLLERTINFENPQRTLNESFERLKPENISEVIYDPDFTHSDGYLRTHLIGKFPEGAINSYIQNTRKRSNHNMCVTGISTQIGDGKKRPVFARKSLLTSLGIQNEADLESALHHEDIHAEEERKGYDFGEKRLSGEEITSLFGKDEIRAEVILGIGEFDAYASQLARINSENLKVSPFHLMSTTTNAIQTYSILESGLKGGTLKPMEKKYFEAKKRKHEEVIETLKKYR